MCKLLFLKSLAAERFSTALYSVSRAICDNCRATGRVTSKRPPPGVRDVPKRLIVIRGITALVQPGAVHLYPRPFGGQPLGHGLRADPHALVDQGVDQAGQTFDRPAQRRCEIALGILLLDACPSKWNQVGIDRDDGLPAAAKAADPCGRQGRLTQASPRLFVQMTASGPRPDRNVPLPCHSRQMLALPRPNS